ncbi:MAG: T9SS type A sorting domain-containing protein [Saprospiraceae bacterium]
MKKPDTMNHLRFFFLLLASFLLAAPAQGQTPTCLDFQDIPLGTVYSAANGNMPGDLILTEENVGVTIGEFHLPNGNTVFGSVTALASPPNFTLGDGVALLSDEMNLIFDFSALSGPLLGAGFGFLEGGGLKNISVNGGDVFVLESFADLPAIVAPGIESQVVYLPGVTPPVGTVLFSGPVHSLTVGGAEIILDNVCFLIEEPNPGCALSNLVFDLQDCDGTGHYNALVNFEYDSVSLAGFSLLLDGQPYGNFSYEDLPVSIGPFFGDGLTSHQIEIVDLANPDCSITGTLESPDCSSDCLAFEGLDQGAIYGQAGGDSPGDLIFTEAGVKVSVHEFDTGGGSVLFGNALVENDPFQTNPPINGNYLFTSNINLVFDFTFLSQPVFAVRFGFVEQGGVLNLQVNGGDLHVVDHFSELPQEVAPGVTATVHQSPGNNWGWVLLEGPVEMLLVGGQELSLDNFCYFQENLPCEISNVTAELTPCENGQFFVILDFDYQNVGNQGFKVQGNGVVYGSFAYGDLPVTIGPLNGNGVTEYEFVVKDIAHPDCQNFTGIDPVDCGGNEPCEIYDLVVEPGECNGDGQYNLTIDFQVQNPGNDFFEVFYNNQIIGYFPLADLPVTIENFEDNGEAVVVIKVCINDANPACCKVKEFESPCPGGDPCLITDLSAEVLPCENGQFYVILNFEYQNVGGEGFKVQGNGVVYGTFEYGDLPVTIGPLNGNGVTVYEFVVKDILHPDCQDFVVIDPVDCGVDPCEIYDLVVEPGECNGDGQYNLTIDFQVQNPGNDFFEVYYNGQVIGFFPLADLPLTIENFEDNGESLVDIKVCINDANPACCKIAVFESPCPGGNPCHIFDLVAETTPCENGQFYVILNFEYQNVGGEGFKVVGNGNNYGVFEYTSLPITLGPFNGDGVTVYEFGVFDLLHPDCGDDTFIDPVECEGGEPCEIYDLVVEPGECNGDGQYNLTIDFQVQNPGNDFFEVYYNNDVIGFYPLADLPLTIENFEDNGEAVVVIKVCINDSNPACCKVTEFESPCPGGDPCLITDLSAEVLPCENGQFYVILNFDYQNVGGEGFKVQGNGVIYGTFEYGDLPVTIGPLNGNGVTVYEFVVKDILHPDCQDFVVIDPVDCGAEGDVWPGDANSDNIANNIDLLNLGIAFGAIGPTRNESSIAWEAWPSMDWAEIFPSGVNFKHADCDGTGSVDGADIEAIEFNYNKTHGDPLPVQYSEGDENDPPLFADLPAQGAVEAGDEIEVPIKLGTAENSVNNIYGLAFTIHFNPELIDPMSVDLVYPVSWLGAPGVNLIRVDKKFVEEGVIDVALVRTDANPVSGFGTIMAFIGIIDDVLGKHELKIEISKVRAITFDDVVLPLRFPEETIIISSAKEAAPLTEGLVAFPNPAREEISWRLSANQQTDYAAIADLNGRLLREQFGAATSMSLQDLPAGLYLLKVQAGEALYVARFVRAGL